MTIIDVLRFVILCTHAARCGRFLTIIVMRHQGQARTGQNISIPKCDGHTCIPEEVGDDRMLGVYLHRAQQGECPPPPPPPPPPKFLGQIKPCM